MSKYSKPQKRRQETAESNIEIVGQSSCSKADGYMHTDEHEIAFLYKTQQNSKLLNTSERFDSILQYHALIDAPMPCNWVIIFEKSYTVNNGMFKSESMYEITIRIFLSM